MSHAHRHINVSRMAGPGDCWGPPASVYDELTECPVCDGDGSRLALEDGHQEREVCPACEGSGWLNEDGTPFKQQEPEYD